MGGVGSDKQTITVKSEGDCGYYIGRPVSVSTIREKCPVDRESGSWPDQSVWSHHSPGWFFPKQSRDRGEGWPAGPDSTASIHNSHL